MWQDNKKKENVVLFLHESVLYQHEYINLKYDSTSLAVSIATFIIENYNFHILLHAKQTYGMNWCNPAKAYCLLSIKHV